MFFLLDNQPGMYCLTTSLVNLAEMAFAVIIYIVVEAADTPKTLDPMAWAAVLTNLPLVILVWVRHYGP